MRSSVALLAVLLSFILYSSGCRNAERAREFARELEFGRSVMDTMIHHLDAMEKFVHDYPSFRLVSFLNLDSIELQIFRYRFFSDTVPHNALRNRIYRLGRPDGGYLYSEDVQDLLGFYGYAMADLLRLREIMNAAGCFSLSHYWWLSQTDKDVMEIQCDCFHDTILVRYTKSYWRPDTSVIVLGLMDTVKGWTVDLW